MKPGDLVKWRNWNRNECRWQAFMGVLLDDIKEQSDEGLTISANTHILTETGIVCLYGKPLYPIDYVWNTRV